MIRQRPKKRPSIHWVRIAIPLLVLVALTPFGSVASIGPASDGSFVEVNVQLTGFPDGARIAEARLVTRPASFFNPFCREKHAQKEKDVEVASLATGAFHLYGKYDGGGAFCGSAIEALRFEVVSKDPVRGEIRLPVEILRQRRLPASNALSVNNMRVRCSQRASGPFECETVNANDVVARRQWQAVVPDHSGSRTMRIERLAIDLNSI